MRIEVAAALDDDVLHAPGDVDLAVGAVCAIARMHPRVAAFSRCSLLGKKLSGSLLISVIPARCGRSPKPQKSFRALRRFFAVGIYNEDFVTRDWFSRGDKGNRRRVIWRRRNRAALAGKRFPFHPAV